MKVRYEGKDAELLGEDWENRFRKLVKFLPASRSCIKIGDKLETVYLRELETDVLECSVVLETDAEEVLSYSV